MPDKPRKLPRLGFAGFEDSSAAGGTGRRKSRWAINPLRAEARASAEGARLATLEGELMQGLGRKPERTE
jgi:hypothetical protein